MAADLTWCETVRARFREVYGVPDKTEGKADHWSLRPVGPNLASINILIDCAGHDPVVWIFDPHSSEDGVSNSIIKSESELQTVFEQVERRLERAAAIRK